MNYREKTALVMQAKVGDRWVHCKTGRFAQIIGIVGRDFLLAHESGRTSRKQMHYFAGDFDPPKPQG